jgi:hypothetical protein
MSRGRGKSQRFRSGNPSNAQAAAIRRERHWEDIIRGSGDREELLARAAEAAMDLHGYVSSLKTRRASLSQLAERIVGTAIVLQEESLHPVPPTDVVIHNQKYNMEEVA